MLELTAVNRYPVKSCRGEALASAVVERWGLAGDRRWMAVDDDGAQLTAREHPRLVLVTPRIRADGGLDLSGPDVDDLTVPVPSAESQLAVQIWTSTVRATMAGDDAHAWMSKVIGTSVRLVHLSDATQRHPNPRFARATDTVNFADAYPVLVATEESLAALNELIAAGPRAAEGPVDMRRLRPGLVVRGAPAWAEDGWRRVRIGEALFRAVKGCDRCILTTVDPDTAAMGREPLATLAKHRRWDGVSWFGMNLIPDTPGAHVSVGDDVEILEEDPDADGPPR